MTETNILNTQEQKRLMVLNRLVVGQLTAAEAAEVLDLSERQVRRLLAAYRKVDKKKKNVNDYFLGTSGSQEPSRE